MWTKRYVRADASGTGDGTTSANSGANGAWTLAQAISGASAGMKMIVLATGGTFANTTTSRTISVSGSTTAPIWWAGCNTAEDDLDSDFATARPAITFTTGQLTLSANHNFFSNLNFSGAQTAGGVVTNGTNNENIWFDLCRVENTAANSGANALNLYYSSRMRFTRCQLKATSTASKVCDFNSMTSSPCFAFDECIFVGGGNGVEVTHTSICTHYIFSRCCFRGIGSHGIVSAGTAGCLYVMGCSFRPGTDGIRFSATIITPANILLARNAFGDVGGYGINNSTGTNTGFVHRVGNLFGAYTSGQENGLGDTPARSALDDSATSPFTSSTDLTLVSGSSGRAAANAGAWPGESFSSYGDVGAVQHQDAGGGGGGGTVYPIIIGG